MTRLHVLAALLAGSTLAAGAALDAQAPDRTKPPAAGLPPALKLPAIQKQRLSNGVPVWMVELHEVPVAQVTLLVQGGSADDPAGKYGVANLMASMLVEGAGTQSSLAIADAIDFLGANLSASAGIDSTGVRLHVPVARLADALPVMADVALRPTFPNEELERLRQQRLTSLLQARDDPSTIAALAFSRVLFGPEHRFGISTMGTASTIKSFTSEDLRSFYATLFKPENATLIVVGDIAPDKVLPLLEKHFGGWQASGTSGARQPLREVTQPSARTVYVVDKPNAPQSQIRIGWIGVPRSTPDYFPILVMNTILGGAFSSRLNLNLREKHGYTYGATSNFDMRVAAGPFSAAAGVQTDKTSEALKEFFNELNGILKTVPADELTRAKNYVALRFPAGFEATTDISRRLEDMVVYQLPDDYFAGYVQNIQAVTAAEVQRVAQKYIAPERFAVVIVGDRKAIDAGVRGLNLGPLRELTVDEVFSTAP
jgi:predicted Zn-dependent peptidase